MRLWPRSLAARTAVVLVAGLVLVQVAGLAIDTVNRIGLERLAEVHNLSIRLSTLYHTIAQEQAAERGAALAGLAFPPGVRARLTESSPLDEPNRLPLASPSLARSIHVAMFLVPMPFRERPHEMVVRGGFEQGHVLIGMRFPDRQGWLVVQAPLAEPRVWSSPTFLAAFGLMSVVAAALTVWAVRRLTQPVRTLAAAAERLGRDVNAPPLSEKGPTEIATAAVAFNTMARRIRRFVEDRVLLVTAIGHDLRTPITRLKLRAEFIEDAEQQRKILADLDELETMVAATLDFGRDAAQGEPAVPLDLAELCQTVLDEASDVHPEAAPRLRYQGPVHCTVRARSSALKRAIANLVANAIAYGRGARVTLFRPEGGIARIEIDDEGPGIPPEELERVFHPFRRLEASRNRETGGVGLGLTIARNVLRAHGGDVALANRARRGLKAIVTLPI